MDRRMLLCSGLALFALPNAGRTSAAQDFNPGVLSAALEAGNTVVLNFQASWSITCSLKREIIADLKRENPSYAANVTFIDVDWDTYGRSRMADRMKVERRSTLVVRKGNRELDRIVADPEPRRIKALLDTALQAALEDS